MTIQPSPGDVRPTQVPQTEGSLRVRVRYCECDPMGVAHHASYVPWLEMGRTELLRSSGVSYADLERAGVFLVVTKMEVRYRRPVYYDDVVEVVTRVSGGSRVKIEHEYEVRLAEDGGHGGRKSGRDGGETTTPRLIGEPLAIAATQLACVGPDGRVRMLPDWLVSEEEPTTRRP